MADATNALLPCPYLTVVYKGITPGEDASSLLLHPNVSAASWSHALDDRDAALEQANRRQREQALQKAADIANDLKLDY